jgi:hypothetical protein
METRVASHDMGCAASGGWVGPTWAVLCCTASTIADGIAVGLAQGGGCWPNGPVQPFKHETAQLQAETFSAGVICELNYYVLLGLLKGLDPRDISQF